MAMRTLPSCLIAATLLAGAVPQQAAAQSQTGTERLKAALIYNILRFVEIRSSDEGVLDLCVTRQTSGFSEIAALNRKTVGDRTINVRQTPLTGLDGCEVVYLGSAGAADIARARREGRAIIGDGSAFVESGGTIALVRMGSQIRFEVNIRSARQSGIEISSKLLRLAARIHQ